MWQKRSTGNRCDQQKWVTLYSSSDRSWPMNLVQIFGCNEPSKWGKHDHHWKTHFNSPPPKAPKLPLTRNSRLDSRGFYRTAIILELGRISSPQTISGGVERSCGPCRWPPDRGFSWNLMRFAEVFFCCHPPLKKPRIPTKWT